MNAANELLRCTQAQTALLDEFILTLEAESTDLQAGPSNLSLVELAQRKGDYAERLSRLDEERARLLGEMDQADSASGIDAICAIHPELRAAFDMLFERAERAGQLNQSNSRVLRTFMEHNQQALDTLHALINQDLYDARGRLPRRP